MRLAAFRQHDVAAFEGAQRESGDLLQDLAGFHDQHGRDPVVRATVSGAEPADPVARACPGQSGPFGRDKQADRVAATMRAHVIRRTSPANSIAQKGPPWNWAVIGSSGCSRVTAWACSA